MAATAAWPRARTLVEEIGRPLGPNYRLELLAFGDAVTRASLDQLSPSARRSNLGSAVEEAVERFRHEDVPGVVVLSGRRRHLWPRRSRARALRARASFRVGIGASSRFATGPCST